jgi:hypothetical protein
MDVAGPPESAKNTLATRLQSLKNKDLDIVSGACSGLMRSTQPDCFIVISYRTAAILTRASSENS